MTSHRRKGIAIVLVVTILAVMILIAMPFLTSMQNRRRRSTQSARDAAANVEVDGALDFARQALYAIRTVSSSPSVPADIQPDQTALKNAFRAMEDDNGTDTPAYQNAVVFNAHVDDEQGKVNINAAPPELIGRVFGSAMILSDTPRVISGNRWGIEIDDIDAFPADNDPATVDGYVHIGDEIHPYVNINQQKHLLEVTGEPAWNVPIVYDARGDFIYWWRFGLNGENDPPHDYDNLYAMRSATFRNPNTNSLEHVAIRPDDMLRLQTYFTTRSWRPKPYSRYVTVMPCEATDDGGISTFYADIEYRPAIRSNRMIRLISPNNDISVNHVVDAGVTVINDYMNHRKRVLRFSIERPVSSRFLPTLNSSSVAQTEIFAPININTASKETLRAILTNAGYTTPGASQQSNNSGMLIIQKDAADQLAEYIVQRRTGAPFTDYSDLLDAIQQGVAAGFFDDSISDMLALYFKPDTASNAFPPPDLFPVPFCFWPKDDFMIDATAGHIAGVDSPPTTARVRESISLALFESEPLVYDTFRKLYAGFALGSNAGTGWSLSPYPPWPMEPNADMWDAPGGLVPEIDSHYLTSAIKRFTFTNYFDIHTRQSASYQNLRVIREATGNGNAFDGAILHTSPDTRRIPSPSYLGAFEIHAWWKPSSPVRPGAALIDLYNNAVTPGTFLYLHRDSNRFVLDMASGELEPDAVTRWEFDADFPADYWTHIVLWSAGNRTNQAMLVVDGNPVPTSTLPPSNTARLGNALTTSDTTCALTPRPTFPPEGYIALGNEIVSYQSNSGGHLDGLKRGACFTTPQAAPSNALVERLGFTLDVDAPYRALTGRLMDDLSDRVSRHTLTMNIDGAQTGIPILNAGEFQQSGYLLIINDGNAGYEIVYYGSRSNASVGSCLRGQLNTSAVPHSAGATIIPISVRVDGMAGSYAEPGMVQVPVSNTDTLTEWIAYDRIVTQNNTEYLVGIIIPQRPPQPPLIVLRAAAGSDRVAYSAASENNALVPVHIVTRFSPKDRFAPNAWQLLADQNGPFGETATPVTLLSPNKTRALLYVRRVAYLNSPTLPAAWRRALCWAMNRNPDADFPIGSKMLRYPCGTLPVFPFQRYISIGEKKNRAPFRAQTLNGKIDQVIVRNTPAYSPLRSRIDDSVKQLTRPPSPGRIPNNATLIVGDEIFQFDGYRRAGNTITLNRLMAFDSTATGSRLAVGTPVDIAGGVYMATALSAVTQENINISINGADVSPPISALTLSSGARQFAPFDGSILDRQTGEVIHYNSLARLGRTYRMSIDPGMRGRFGTSIGVIEPDQFIQQIPVRHRDGFVSRRRGYQEHFLELSDMRPNAFWTGLHLKITGMNRYRYQSIIIRIIFDANAAWDDPPVSSFHPDRLTEVDLSDSLSGTRGSDAVFPDDPNAVTVSFRSGDYPDGIPATTVRARIYIQYKPGAFKQSHDWTMAPVIDGWAFSRHRAEQVYRREVVDD